MHLLHWMRASVACSLTSIRSRRHHGAGVRRWVMPIRVEGLAPLIQVFDMPTSIAFFRDRLGFTVASQSQSGDDCDWCLLRLNDAKLMLNTAYEKEHRPAVPDPARVAAHE